MKTLNLRNSISRSPWRRGFLLIPLVLACFVLVPRAQAQTLNNDGTISLTPAMPTVSPDTAVLATPDAAVLATPEMLTASPDEAVGGFNTRDGLNALDSLTTGTFNSAFGFNTLTADTTGSHNTGLGAQALLKNTVGSYNTAVGENAMVFNIDGVQNMALGQGALANNLTGDNNTAMGFQALNRNTTTGNVGVGFQALFANTTGGTPGSSGINEVGPNTAVGTQALFNNLTSGGDVAVGFQAATNLTAGYTTAVGFKALASAAGNIGGAAFGYKALTLATGSFNTGLGDGAGATVTSGGSNIIIGSTPGGRGEVISSASNVICIGLPGTNTSNRTYINNIYSPVAIARAVFVNADGQLGTLASSRRYKEEIKPMDKSSEALLALKPVTFRYKKDVDPARMLSFGLIAEEVAEISPDLITRDEQGKPQTVRYEAVNAMLLNEFLKEHRSVQDLKATVAQQQKQIEALTTGLQKVSDQLELTRSTPQVVANHQ
jgi:Chaperone of endosialidase